MLTLVLLLNKMYSCFRSKLYVNTKKYKHLCCYLMETKTKLKFKDLRALQVLIGKI